jgi:hypothetical protein
MWMRARGMRTKRRSTIRYRSDISVHSRLAVAAGTTRNRKTASGMPSALSWSLVSITLTSGMPNGSFYCWTTTRREGV